VHVSTLVHLDVVEKIADPCIFRYPFARTILGPLSLAVSDSQE